MSKAKDAPKVPDTLPPTEDRTIRLVGPIDEDMYLRFSEELADFEADYSLKPIHIELNSEGGEAIQGLAIADRIRNSSCHVHVTCYGHASSAASMILAAGDYRSIAANAWVMLHDDSGRLKGKTDDLLNEAKQVERQEQQWADLLAELSGTPEDVWRKLSRKTTYLDARQCLQLGLVDQILKGKKRANSLR